MRRVGPHTARVNRSGDESGENANDDDHHQQLNDCEGAALQLINSCAGAQQRAPAGADLRLPAWWARGRRSQLAMGALRRL